MADSANTTDAPTTGAMFTAPNGNPGSGRFAVYDLQLGRFVGGVTDKRPTDTAAAKLAEHYAVVEV